MLSACMVIRILTSWEACRGWDYKDPKFPGKPHIEFEVSRLCCQMSLKMELHILEQTANRRTCFLTQDVLLVCNSCASLQVCTTFRPITHPGCSFDDAHILACRTWARTPLSCGA
jgi:hypothetical protein